MADNVTLTIETPGAAPQTFSVTAEGPIIIGREEKCTVVLAAPDISRQHTFIQAFPTHLVVSDNSANGTRVGDQLIRKGQSINVPHGTPVQVGPYIVKVVAVQPMGAMPGAAPNPAAFPNQQAFPPQQAPFGIPPAGPTGGFPQPQQPPFAGAPFSPQGGYPPQPAHMPAVPPAAQPPVHQPPPPQPPAHAPTKAGDGHPEAPKKPKASVAVRKKVHRMLLDHLDLASIDRQKMDDKVMRPRVRNALKTIAGQLSAELPPSIDIEGFINEMTNEALGLGPLEEFLADNSISEIMVVDPYTIFVERKGRLVLADAGFTDDEAVRAVIERIVTPLGRRIDESTPLVDARLKDGSRVNAVIKPLALKGSCITIRKFSKTPLKLADLVKFGGMTEQMGRFLTRSVKAKKNCIISGGTGSGKTTLLNVLSSAIPGHERIVTIEDAAELQLGQPHVVSLESRPANMEGKGEYTIRDLVKNALRMRPDRIVIGECRGGEALDMLQAMNTGHDGSLTTTHSNSPREAVARIETLCLMSGLDLPARAIREQIANSVHLIVQQTRFNDGSRRVSNISEVVGIDDTGDIELREIFTYRRLGTDKDGKVVGEFRATGYLPSFLDTFISYGLVEGKDYL